MNYASMFFLFWAFVFVGMCFGTLSKKEWLLALLYLCIAGVFFHGSYVIYQDSTKTRMMLIKEAMDGRAS